MEGRTTDSSIMTYSQHRILQTLIRCRFSPESTGQRYIYTGSYTGNVTIYDVITGGVVSELSGHRGTVRDLHWHPNLPVIMTSSWDNTVLKWECGNGLIKKKKEEDKMHTNSGDTEDDRYDRYDSD